MKKASKSRRKDGIWQPTGQPTKRIDPHTSLFPQCCLTVCTAYLQVEIYSHIEMHSYRTRTALAHTIMYLQVEIYSHIEIPHSHFNKNLNNDITQLESEF